jgi:Fe-S cluster assembly protein SufD
VSGPFTTDAAAALPGPEWLCARRAAAAERFAAASLPSTDEEVWRYSRIAEIDLDAYRLDAPAPSGIPAGLLPLGESVAERAALVVTVDGRVVHREVDEGLAAKGLEVGPAGEDDLGSVAARPTDVFAEMNDAFVAEPVVVRVPRGLTVERPVVVANWVATDGVASFPRLVVRAGEDSDVTVLAHAGSDPVTGFVAPVVELEADQAARVRYLGVQDLGLAVWQIGSLVSRVGRDASLLACTAALGGDYARLRTDCRMDGQGASGDLLAVYFGEGDQTLDFRTFQDHAAPDTTSDLLFKGAVGGRSRSVYTGLIRVRKEGRGTNAFQTNRTVKLSEHAWAESVPNLEIENNDVRCSHASAIGPIDEEQRFYLESRGVPPAIAERLVVTGFFDEVLARLPVPPVVDALRRRVAAKLEMRHG